MTSDSALDHRAARLAELERERRELAASLPAHSTPASLLIRLEDLEDEIAALRAALESSAPHERTGFARYESGGSLADSSGSSGGSKP
jgi:hypothetical protein